jgi:hypothetical protein
MEQTLTLTINPQDAQVILTALAMRPLGEVLGTFMKIRAQLAMAAQPSATPPSPGPGDKPHQTNGTGEQVGEAT